MTFNLYDNLNKLCLHGMFKIQHEHIKLPSK